MIERMVVTHERPGTADEALVEAWRQGSSSAGHQLFERHYRTVHRFFRNKLPAAASGDLIQETFLACVEGRTRFRPGASFRAYLLGIAHHVLVDHLRARGRRGDPPLDVAEVVLADLQPLPEEAMAARRQRRLLLRALRLLRFPLQVVLELRYWEGLSDTEIAAVLDEPVGTVKTRLRAARAALEVQLARQAHSHDELRSTLDSLARWASRVGRAGRSGDATDEPRDDRAAHG
jgi:RNA polymerase sigma-70 factor (ECF subfamily)